MWKEHKNSIIEKLGARRSYNNRVHKRFGCGKNIRVA